MSHHHKNDEPTHTLKIRGFDDDVTRGTVIRAMNREKCPFKEITISQEKSHGVVKNVALIDMYTIDDALRFYKDVKGEVEMRGDLYRLYYHHDDPYEEPTSTILMRNIHPSVTEADICAVLNGQQLHYLDVRIIRQKHTGVSRGFGFLDFASVNEAKGWMDSQKGRFMVNGFEVKLNFSSSNTDERSRSSDANSSGLVRGYSSTSLKPSVDSDWVCSRCSSHNFRRRDVCFTCQLPRSHSKSLVCSEDGSDFVGNAPCNTLVIRGLDAFTQEQDILRVFESACEVKIRQAHVMRQEDTHLSKGYALVEFLNVADAYKVIQEIKSKQFFEISGKAVQVDYSKNTFTTIMSTLRSEGSFNAKFYAERNEIQQIKSSLNTASAMALAESALLRHHNNTKVSSVLSQAIKAQPYTPPVVNNPPVMPFNAATCHLVTYPFPDTTKFIFDEPTRYFYDSHTGLLYDPNSKYFFDRQTQGYFYFDQTRYQYIPVTQQLASNIVSQEPAPPGIPPPPTNVLNDPIQSHLDEAKAEVKEMKKREEKDKKARQIARDMEKWAKRMNSMKDTAAGGKSAKDDFNNKDTGSKTADMAFKMLEKKSAVETYQPTKSASVAKAFVDDDDEDDEGTVKPESSRNNSPDNNSMDSETLVAEEEKSLIDWNKLACLLCSRGFKDNATLTKHTSTSSLHLENLNKLRLKYNLLPLSSLQEKETHSLEYLMKLGAQKAVGHDASTRKLSTLDSQNYRDRAHERRMRHGFGDPAGVPNVPVPIVDPCLAAGPILEMPPEKPMDNVGNKLLAKMGWEEGQGLGKSNQGRTELIEPEMRQMGVGLGNANSRKHGLPGDDYKANVKKSMYARYYSVK